jgi:putative flavoprotein involved in K+ transport
MNGWTADLISQEVADAVGRVSGLGSDTTKNPGPWEGEQRNMWKPTQQEACGSTAATCTSRGTTRCT